MARNEKKLKSPNKKTKKHQEPIARTNRGKVAGALEASANSFPALAFKFAPTPSALLMASISKTQHELDEVMTFLERDKVTAGERRGGFFL